MKKTSTFAVGLSAILFTSCIKEPSACFTFSNSNPEIFEEVTFNNCSEDAESYDWSISTSFLQSSSSEENPRYAWNQEGTYSVELEALSKKDKKSDVVTNSITVSDICYDCVYSIDIFGIVSTSQAEYCASGSSSKAEYESDLKELKDAGWVCTKQ
jgi:PKD repeat protein